MKDKMTPMETDELPKIHLPGDEKFQSYKTTLQDYCYKKKFQTPQYLAEKTEDGLVGTVSFGCSYVKCESISGSMKEADIRAAYEALKQLGYLSGHEFEMPSSLLKRKVADDTETNAAKQIKPGTIAPITSKGHLNQLAQRQKFPTPSYTTLATSGGFFSTVTIGDKQFKSKSICLKRKDAEQSAAEAALDAFGPVAVPHPQIKAEETAKVVHQSGVVMTKSMKSSLQEYCQKASKPLPVYEVKHNETDKVYQAAVTVDGITYCGQPEKGKKTAEMAAAEVALKALGQVA